jgi:signal recognition particle receptor subunit beta
MVSINYAFKEIISKIVYYGPGLSGKTTNLQYVFKKVPKDTRGELISLATDADRTLYFDFLPVNVGNIKGFSIKYQLYTVPGQVYYNATRKLVLRGVDGLVFVADSQIEKMDDNVESLKNLEENLAEYGYSLAELPYVIQYNKRDLPNIAPIEHLQKVLNARGVPYFEAVATTGAGVFATLKAISKLVIDRAQSTSTDKPEKPRAVVMSSEEKTEEKPKPQPVGAPVSVSADNEIEAAGRKSTTGGVRTSETAEIEEASVSDDKISDDSVGSSKKPGRLHQSEQLKYEDSGQTRPRARTEEGKPKIASETDAMTNVVVSSHPEEVDSPDTESEEEDLEETTEHSVLKDESNGTDGSRSALRRHPDVLDADKIGELYKPGDREPISAGQAGFDDEATVISDPKQPVALSEKPHMAESIKVKGKKRIGLFGWLKKKKVQ